MKKDDTPPRERPCRVTSVLQLCYEQPGEPAAGFDFRVAYKVPPADEVPWVRRQQVGATWAPLDFGWLAGAVGVVAIENLAGTGRNTFPSEEEQAAIDRQVIEVAFGVGSPAACTIRPGAVMLLEPTDAGVMLVRCAAGGASVRLVALPGGTKTGGDEG